MAEKLSLLNQFLFGDFADRAAINRNADHLSTVEARVTELQALSERQAKEILQLRAMLMGVVDVLRDKAGLTDADIERAIQAAWTTLSPPPKQAPQQGTDPYRNTPAGEPTAADIEAAKALLKSAQDHHFSKRFQEARAAYQQVVDRYADTKQAATARQQLENLRKS